MKFTFSWLKEHLNTTASLDEVVDALTDLGLEVEEVSDPIKKLNHFSMNDNSKKISNYGLFTQLSLLCKLKFCQTL